jgi:hypothetical protein
MELKRLKDKLNEINMDMDNDFDPFGEEDWEKVEKQGAYIHMIGTFPPKFYVKYKSEGKGDKHFVYKITDSGYKLVKIKPLKSDHVYTHINEIDNDIIDDYIESYIHNMDYEYSDNDLFKKMVDKISENMKSRSMRTYISKILTFLKKNKYDV